MSDETTVVEVVGEESSTELTEKEAQQKAENLEYWQKHYASISHQFELNISSTKRIVFRREGKAWRMYGQRLEDGNWRDYAYLLQCKLGQSEQTGEWNIKVHGWLTPEELPENKGSVRSSMTFSVAD